MSNVRGRFLTHLSGWFCLRLMKRNGVLLRKTGIMSSIILTAGNGLEDLDYKEIIDAIGNSI